VVQDHLGGTLVRVIRSNEERHYWNRLPFGELDFARSQFPDDEEFSAIEEIDRLFVLSEPELRADYLVLSSRL
jgi:hypothetical protein